MQKVISYQNSNHHLVLKVDTKKRMDYQMVTKMVLRHFQIQNEAKRNAKKNDLKVEVGKMKIRNKLQEQLREQLQELQEQAEVQLLRV